ncbi:MAG TPA: Na+ dependent nucleoside transporter N-terminal domain-containing protein, partial [Saprospiraceae bacterium]|nr:Na+ dependent nucleoside transporter N-terminal domain-containing protein [Saprospiraceae bacterium]
MERFIGLIGIVLILGIAFLMSNNRKRINYRLVLSGLALQLGLALFILKVPIGKTIFAGFASIVT